MVDFKIQATLAATMLAGAVLAATAVKAAPPAPPVEKATMVVRNGKTLMCHKEIETGSNLKAHKVCVAIRQGEAGMPVASTAPAAAVAVAPAAPAGAN